jgi:hypothetical protein
LTIPPARFKITPHDQYHNPSEGAPAHGKDLCHHQA